MGWKTSVLTGLPELTSVRSTKDCMLKYEKGFHNKVWFIYNTGHMCFHFNLLCEIGERYKSTFTSLLEGYRLEYVDGEGFEKLIKL
jgi:hypothetical protein